jgi:hypothetical protein
LYQALKSAARVVSFLSSAIDVSCESARESIPKRVSS